jgi:curved DNA-binding protein CbpA
VRGPSLTHYDVLGVPPHATQAELRAAYRAKARDHHPDAGGDAARMQALNAAWGVLGDPRRRAAYDRELARGAPGGTGPAGAPRPGSTAASDGWPIDPEARLSAEEWAELVDGRPIGPTMALQGWWAILPPATLLSSVGLFVGALLFRAPALLGFAAGALVLALGLFVLAPLRAMAHRPPGDGSGGR